MTISLENLYIDPAFSLNFSSVGKGPFMAGKTKKCVPQAHFPGGGG